MKTYRREYDLQMIGDNLRRLRQQKHLSVEEVREYLRLGSVQAVYKYERGLSYPQADTMFALMELYEATLYDIIGYPVAVTDKEEDEKSSSSVIYAIRTYVYAISSFLPLLLAEYFPTNLRFCERKVSAHSPKNRIKWRKNSIFESYFSCKMTSCVVT